jgi:hypothetical protein
MYALIFALGGVGGFTAAVTTAWTFLREHISKQRKSAAPSNIVTITDSEGHIVELNMTGHVDAIEIARKLTADYGSKPSDPGPAPLAT